MADLSICPDCGSSDIVDDSHYSQSQLVCADCGFILTEGLLTSTQAEEGFSQGVRFSDSTGENDAISRYKLRGIVRVRDLCKALRLPATFEATAVSYFERAFLHPAFHYASLQKKEVVVGCCVYVTCRQHTWPLTMGTICSLLYSNRALFSNMYLRVVKVLNLDVPALGLAELVKTHCKSFKLFQPDSNVPPDFSEDVNKVVERTLQVVEVASDTWLVTGRHPIPIITAAAYLAWQSLRPACRMACPFSRFCKLSETDQPPPSNRRLKELYGVLTRLAAQLPWLKMLTINAKMAVQYLSDILRHRNFLLRQSLGVCVRNDGTQDHCWPVAGSEDVLLEVQSTSEGAGLQAVKVRGGTMRGLKRPFLPPCVEKPRKRVLTQPLSEEQAVTGEEDISDSEIEACLRTQDEMAEYLKARPWD